MLGQIFRITRSNTTRSLCSAHIVAPGTTAEALIERSRLRLYSTMIEGLSENCWNQSGQTVQHPALSKDLHTDVCIVGAGIAGLTTAYKLAAAGTPNAWW